MLEFRVDQIYYSFEPIKPNIVAESHKWNIRDCLSVLDLYKVSQQFEFMLIMAQYTRTVRIRTRAWKFKQCVVINKIDILIL